MLTDRGYVLSSQYLFLSNKRYAYSLSIYTRYIAMLYLCFSLTKLLGWWSPINLGLPASQLSLCIGSHGESASAVYCYGPVLRPSRYFIINIIKLSVQHKILFTDLVLCTIVFNYSMVEWNPVKEPTVLYNRRVCRMHFTLFHSFVTFQQVRVSWLTNRIDYVTMWFPFPKGPFEGIFEFRKLKEFGTRTRTLYF